ncbi:unnamed protein product [Dicrocoelium dendriticum]|nr:unnamed protein product [Dicrocoelium dendriticum]
MRNWREIMAANLEIELHCKTSNCITAVSFHGGTLTRLPLGAPHDAAADNGGMVVVCGTSEPSGREPLAGPSTSASLEYPPVPAAAERRMTCKRKAPLTLLRMGIPAGCSELCLAFRKAA